MKLYNKNDQTFEASNKEKFLIRAKKFKNELNALLDKYGFCFESDIDNTNDDYDVIKIFNIQVDNQEIIKKAGDTVITKEIVKEKCISFTVNFMFITTAFVIYILIVLLGIFYWCKYRNVTKNYQKVVEVEIPSVSKRETNIEIVRDSKNSSNQQENSKENP